MLRVKSRYNFYSFVVGSSSWGPSRWVRRDFSLKFMILRITSAVPMMNERRPTTGPTNLQWVTNPSEYANMQKYAVTVKLS